MVTVVTAARSTDLTTLQRVKGALRLTTADPTRDAELQLLVAEASDTIERKIERVLRRELVDERIEGSGRTTALVTRRPVAEIVSVNHDDLGDVGLTDIRIVDAGAGIIGNESGWGDESPLGVWLGADPLAQTGRAPWLVRTKAGFFLPGDALVVSGALAADGTLTLSSGTLPLLAAGEVVRLSGFLEAANNGRFAVSARTSDTVLKLVGTFTVETAPADALLDPRTLPAELERFAIETAKAWWLSSGRDPSLSQESLGDWSATYGRKTSLTTKAGILPETVAEAIEAWVAQA